MKRILTHPFKGKTFLIAISLAFLLTPINGFAQKQEKVPKGVVPPPLNVLSKNEKKQLNAKKKPKERTKLALLLMDSRLVKSRKQAEESQFEDSLKQLGNFKAVMQNTLRFLKNNRARRGSFKNFKKFEMTLRGFLPRLELVRRKMPFKYSYHVIQLMKTVRNARRAAIDPLFDDTVLPQGN